MRFTIGAASSRRELAGCLCRIRRDDSTTGPLYRVRILPVEQVEVGLVHVRQEPLAESKIVGGSASTERLVDASGVEIENDFTRRQPARA